MNADNSREPFEYLSEVLGFPPPDPKMQDWGIIMANGERVVDFCDVYETTQLTPIEKFLLMELIVASYDEHFYGEYLVDSVLKGQSHNAELWERVAELLRRDWDLHKTTVAYWRMLEDTLEEEKDAEEVFPVKFFMRQLWDEMNSAS